MLPITHKYLSSHETRKHRHIFARVASFWQRVFQTLPNLDVHPGVTVYHTLKIFSTVNAKNLLMPHTKFQVCTLKINTIFCHRKKKSHYFWTGVYQLPWCRPGYLSQNVPSYCRWLWWWRTSGRFYSHPHQGITHHCLCIQHFPIFPGDCMLLFNAMPAGWVMAWTTKLRKYTHVHDTARLLQMKEHALSLNIQISTNK